MNLQLAEQLEIAAQIERGEAKHGWDFRKENPEWQTALDRTKPAWCAIDGYEMRIRHKWQAEKDAFERGEKVERRNYVPECCTWSAWYADSLPHWDCLSEVEFRIAPKPALIFPTPPEGEELVTEFQGKHLTPEEFEVDQGWRPLQKSEHGTLVPNCQMWDDDDGWIERLQGDDVALDRLGDSLYRTREPFPQKPEYVPLTMEDWFTGGPWMISVKKDGGRFPLEGITDSAIRVYLGGELKWVPHTNAMTLWRFNFSNVEELCRKIKA